MSGHCLDCGNVMCICGFDEDSILSIEDFAKTISRISLENKRLVGCISEIARHIESFEHTEKRYKEVYGEDAKIDFAKLAEIRVIAQLARKTLEEVENDWRA